MPEGSMAIAHSEEVLPGFGIDVGVDDEGILVDLAAVGGDVSLLGAIGEAHDILEEILLPTHLGFAQVLPDQVQQRARFLTLLLLRRLPSLLLPAVARVARSTHRFRQLLLVLPGAAAVEPAAGRVQRVDPAGLAEGADLQVLVLWLLAAFSCIIKFLLRCSSCGLVFWVVRGRCRRGRTPRAW